MCRHHWLIEIPDGPTSMGVCIRCGERRLFRNSDDFYSNQERKIAAHTMYSTGPRPAEATVYD